MKQISQETAEKLVKHVFHEYVSALRDGDFGEKFGEHKLCHYFRKSMMEARRPYLMLAETTDERETICGWFVKAEADLGGADVLLAVRKIYATEEEEEDEE